VAGGPAPPIAVTLLAQYGSGYAVQAIIFYPAIASVAATLLLPDDTNKDISARWGEPIQRWLRGLGNPKSRSKSRAHNRHYLLFRVEGLPVIARA
jgi:hypothetical protein